MKAVAIQEPVAVLCRCLPGRLEPLRFTWQNRDFTITRQHACWHQTDATGQPRLYFSVQVNHDTYFLSFAPHELHWQLEQVISD